MHDTEVNRGTQENLSEEEKQEHLAQLREWSKTIGRSIDEKALNPGSYGESWRFHPHR